MHQRNQYRRRLLIDILGGERMEVKDSGKQNTISVGDNIGGLLHINGDGNYIKIGNSLSPSKFRINISGDNNRIEIENLRRAHSLKIDIGNHVKARRSSIFIGPDFSCENDVEFLVYGTDSTLSIGSDCMFSREIIIRTSESPHLIFDNLTSEYLDVSDGVFIGNHVWIGERAYITKRCKIADGCIVAACAVATKAFSEPNCAIGGNPARVIRRYVRWFRNHSFLEQGTRFREQWERQRD